MTSSEHKLTRAERKGCRHCGAKFQLKDFRLSNGDKFSAMLQYHFGDCPNNPNNKPPMKRSR